MGKTIEQFIKNNHSLQNKSIIQYIKEQESILNFIEEKIKDDFLNSDDFYFYINEVYNYVRSINYKNLPIKYREILYDIDRIKRLDVILKLYLFFSAEFITLKKYRTKPSILFHIADYLKSSDENFEEYMKFLMLSLHSLKFLSDGGYEDKELFNHHIYNFKFLKDYLPDNSLYEKQAIKIKRKYPDAKLEIDSQQNPACSNLFYEEPVYKIQDDTGKITYCFDQEEYDEYLKTKHNPFKPDFIVSKSRKQKSLYINQQDPEDIDLDNTLYHWTDQIYTKNRIFKKFTQKQLEILASTIPLSNVTLYRGMSTTCNEESITQDGKCKIEFKTYSSWSYSKQIANHFTSGTGVLLQYTFTPEQIIADLTRIKNRRTAHKHELEVIAKPGVYECEIIQYTPNDEVFGLCDPLNIKSNIKKIKNIVNGINKENIENWVKRRYTELPYKQFSTTLELIRNNHPETIDKFKNLINKSYPNIVDNYELNNLIICWLLTRIEHKSDSFNYQFINSILKDIDEYTYEYTRIYNYLL